MASRRNGICLVMAVAIAFGTLFLCYGYKATWRPALAGIIWFVPNHKWISYVVDETANWLLFALLLYLFFLTLPDWLRLWMQRVMIRDQPKSVVASL